MQSGDPIQDKNLRISVNKRTEFALKEMKKRVYIKDVLEIGSATGYSSNLLFREGYNVRGIEFNSESIKVAKKRYPHIIFEEESAEDYCRGHYDAIILLDVIEHIRDYKKALKNIHYMLKPQGILIITTDNVKYTKNLYEYSTKEFTYEELKELLPDSKIMGSGFHYVYTKPITFLFGAFYAIKFRYLFNFVAKYFPKWSNTFYLVVKKKGEK